MEGNYTINYGNYNFFSFKSYFDSFIPIKKHSFRNLVYFIYNRGNNIPFQYYLLNEDEKFHAGISKYNVYGENLIGSRSEFIYQHKIDIFFHLFYNPIIFAKYENIKNPQLINAAGIMISLKSPIGPVNLTWSVSPEKLYKTSNLTYNFYLSGGYRF